jgi:hypothetical protein
MQAHPCRSAFDPVYTTHSAEIADVGEIPAEAKTGNIRFTAMSLSDFAKTIAKHSSNRPQVVCRKAFIKLEGRANPTLSRKPHYHYAVLQRHFHDKNSADEGDPAS